MSDDGRRLIEFYGDECTYCVAVAPIVEQVEKDTGKHVTRLEVWHDRENKKVFGKYAHEVAHACGGSLGVPAFYNEKTGEALCGYQPYEEILRWATA